ncbi:RCC1/BLIP-II [Auricularia subglabra TFB-10046 SS5]|nr:RCC1/BLIP-II [Auricularia subglabra TFB-10046 SS5]
MPARARSNAEPTRVSARIKAAPPKPEPKPKPAPAARAKRKTSDEHEDANGAEPKAKRGRPKKDDAPQANGHKPKKLPPIGADDLNKLPRAAEHLRPARHLFVFGDTDGFPQLGLGADTTSISRPRLHAWVKEAVEEDKLGGPGAGFEAVVSGAMHTLAIDEEGRMWSWGINDEGQLGRVTNDVEDPANPGQKLDKDELEATPALIQGLDHQDFRAVRIAAGGSVSVALSDEGEVRSWGSFKWDGLLGFDSGAPGPTRQFTPQVMPDLARYRFVSVACGQDHVLALTTTGLVFSWGNGEDSQLGRRILDRRRRNALMADRLALRHIVYIAAGHNTSFAMDKDGVVYAWGLNGYGQTGVDPEDGGDENVIEHPTRVKALHPFVLGGRRVAQIVSANAHTLWRLEDGTLYGCGRNDEAQLGLAPNHPQAAEGRVRTPVHIRLPDPPTESDPNPALPAFSAKDATGPQANKVVSMAASGWHNLAVSDAGNVYCWGWGANHQLALGPSAEKQVVPTMIKNTALNSGWKILDVATGSHHGILVAVKPETD